MVSDTERAWAAGFWDGEGCTSLFFSRSKSQPPIPYVRMGVGQKDPRPLIRFHGVVGVGRIYSRTCNGQPFHYWSAQSLIDTVTVENVLWEFLSEPKREQLAAKRAHVRDARARLIGAQP